MLEFISALPDWTWILTAVIGLLTLFLARHLLQVMSLPPGPFPLPILGNILALRGKGNELLEVLSRLQKKHKAMFTFWLGPRPTIFVCDWKLIQEGLVAKRNDFSGRVTRHTTEILLSGNQDVAFTDFGPAQEALRKILSNAVRKYVVSDKLPELVSDVVDRTTETMMSKGEEIDASTFMYFIIYNILASSCFGVRFELDDPVFIELKSNNDELNEKFGNGLPTDALPFLKMFYRKRVKEITDRLKKVQDYIALKLIEHEETYQTGDIRDFTDAVLASREEAIEEGKEIAQYLTEGNVHMILMNLFAAGTDTTRVLLLWILLIIGHYPEVQRKMQEEVDQKIGSRQPIQKDKESCPYIYAVMTETLRWRPVLDITLEHKTVYNTELGGYKIPKDTSVFFYIDASHTNTDYWDEPDKFKPERFLDSEGKYMSNRVNSYLPFGLGRRSCPGEKLAIADTFLIMARLLQKHNVELQGGPGSGNMSKNKKSLANFPEKFKVILKKRDVNN